MRIQLHHQGFRGILGRSRDRRRITRIETLGGLNVVGGHLLTPTPENLLKAAKLRVTRKGPGEVLTQEVCSFQDLFKFSLIKRNRRIGTFQKKGDSGFFLVLPGPFTLTKEAVAALSVKASTGLTTLRLFTHHTTIKIDGTAEAGEGRNATILLNSVSLRTELKGAITRKLPSHDGNIGKDEIRGKEKGNKGNRGTHEYLFFETKKLEGGMVLRTKGRTKKAVFPITAGQ